MELRSRTNRRLVDFLKSAGVYEEGMDIEEMTELASVVQQSASISPQDDDLERALQESELEFLTSHPSALHNSTMIISPQMARRNPSDMDSPSEPIRITFRALVHHAMDWDPTSEHRIPDRKRSAADNNQIAEVGGKRSRSSAITIGQTPEEEHHQADVTPVIPGNEGAEGDSGVSWEEVSLSTASESSTLPSIGEMPDRHLISTSSVAVSDFSDVNEISRE
ncbi:uncharacterized protein LOC6541638 [Drosophila erecta]|uniref:Uncharacterized protein n=1 Tax=Drosophila erecta TaxID=7220 RepID=B3N4G5_DROER|nr:uncharacterized protein LOC6541638 [Drosophila erecta]EDV58877.1 uncharacterized protein Dere_GG23733 [Drosophila erecta]